MERFKDLFFEETQEILQEIEQTLIALEEDSDDPEKISALFRWMHTIKGSAAMFGYDALSSYTHEIESCLTELRNGKINVSRQLIDLLLESADDIRNMLHDIIQFGQSSEGIQEGTTIEKLKNLLEQKISFQAKEEEHAYRIMFKPSEDIFLNGTNPLLLLEELQKLGKYSCTGNFGDIPILTTMDPEKCYISWDILLTSTANIQTIKDVFIFVENYSEVNIQPIPDSKNPETEEEQDMGAVVSEVKDSGDVQLVDDFLPYKDQRNEIDTGEELRKTDPDVSAKGNEDLHQPIERGRTDIQSAHIKVRSEKLDTLVDLVGELVTAQAQLRQVCTDISVPALNAVTEHLDLLISSLRESSMSLRMLPIGSTFNRFQRMVRDLSHKMGKQVELVIEGAETELDKTVIERLYDPMLHLIRNCIDHGIEKPQKRRRLGKSETGVIRLSAFHSGTSVLIKVEDDGAGLNREAILEKAKNKGIISATSTLSEQEVYDLIFDPGFSTAQEVTDISGRGVGLDVVLREIENLQGKVSVSTKENAGSSFTLKLPLTLAIIEGFLFHTGGYLFVVPLSNVEECVEFSGLNMVEKSHRRMVNVRGGAVPYIRLKEIFKLEEKKDTDKKVFEQMIILCSEHTRIGLVVDGVIGNQQTVIKSLGAMYKDLNGISGTTILGDGSFAFILDINGILEIASEEPISRAC